VAHLVRRRLVEFWPSARAQAVLGIGPCGAVSAALARARDALHRRHPRPDRRRALARNCPQLILHGGRDALPFPDLSFDKVLMVHGLEAADNARRLLREVCAC